MKTIPTTVATRRRDPDDGGDAASPAVAARVELTTTTVGPGADTRIGRPEGLVSATRVPDRVVSATRAPDGSAPARRRGRSGYVSPGRYR